jgi:hypothetical protein
MTMIKHTFYKGVGGVRFFTMLNVSLFLDVDEQRTNKNVT